MGSGKKRHAWKRWLGAFFALCLLAAGGLAASIAIFPPEGVLILEYHKVNDWSDDSYTVPTAEFAAQLDELSARGYTTISLLDFLRAKKGKQKLPDKPVILTFDDGYLDNYTDMLPLLDEGDSVHGDERHRSAGLFDVGRLAGHAGARY